MNLICNSDSSVSLLTAACTTIWPEFKIENEYEIDFDEATSDGNGSTPKLDSRKKTDGLTKLLVKAFEVGNSLFSRSRVCVRGCIINVYIAVLRQIQFLIYANNSVTRRRRAGHLSWNAFLGPQNKLLGT